MRAVSSHVVHLPDLDRFTESVGHVRAYVRGEPGAHGALMDTARRDPEGTTASLVALGAVLLDIAAGAFAMRPDEVLDKVSAQVAGTSPLRSVSPVDGTVPRQP
ncbi:MAG: hypothetical protein JWN08_57 [Frankiales bacterium]|nr:hypothetical protein [Frankiales bacterium]